MAEHPVVRAMVKMSAAAALSGIVRILSAMMELLLGRQARTERYDTGPPFFVDS